LSLFLSGCVQLISRMHLQHINILMENPNWKYQEQIRKFADCPPSDYKPVDMIAFRWVFKDKSYRNNFLPPLAIDPSRKLKNDKLKCSGYALSFFNSLENAKKRYLFLSDNNPQVFRSLGEYIARVEIKSDDGIASAPDIKGHFDLHEFAKADLEHRFTWICKAED